MSIRVLDHDGIVTVSLAGEIDLETSPEVRRTLLEQLADGRALHVDMAEVNYIDSSGIASLVEAHQRAQDRGQEFVLVRVSAPVMKVLRLARLDRVFTIR